MKQSTRDFDGSPLTGVDSYRIYRSESFAGPFELIATTTTTSFTDSGLLSRTIYYYQFESLDAEGNVSPRSITVALTTGGVDMPKNVRLAASTPASPAQPPVVTIRWDAAAGALLYYEVQRTTVPNSIRDADYTNVLPNTLSTSRDDNGVVRGTTYYYRVRSRDVDNRVSDWTQPLSVDVRN